jgi:hypothetical protein
MKTLALLPVLLGALLLSSCGDVYVKDAVSGTPYERVAKKNYRIVKADGASSGEAYRQSLLVGVEKSNKEWDRRAADKKSSDELDDAFGGKHESFLQSLLPSFHWN